MRRQRVIFILFLTLVGFCSEAFWANHAQWAARPIIDLNFMSQTLPSQVTFTRAVGGSDSPGTYFNSNGLMVTSAADTPRFDYDPTNCTPTCAPLGIMIEGARTNLVTQSTWVVGGGANAATLVASAMTAPDGSTIPKLVENTANSRHYGSRFATLVANTAYTYSVFVKAGERSKVLLYGGKSGAPYTRGGMTVDLTNGTFINSDVGAPTLVTNRLVYSVGNGWWRISMTVIIDGASTDGYMEVNMDNGSTATYAGDGTSGFYIWGAQIEQGKFLSSYIPTSGTALTRNADRAVVSDVTWNDPAHGTFLVKAKSGYLFNSSIEDQVQIAASFESAAERIQLRRLASSTTSNDGRASTLYYNGAAVGGGNSAHDVWPKLTTRTLSLAYQLNDFAWTYGNGTVGTSTSGTLFSPTKLLIGSSDLFGTPFYGWIQSVKVYNGRLPDAQLSAITPFHDLDSTWMPQWGNLVWYWKMNGNPGPLSTTAFTVDKGGTTCTGPASTATFVVGGKVNQGINSTANVSADMINCDGSVVNAINDNVSYGGWVKAVNGTVTAYKAIFATRSGSNGYSISRYNMTNKYQIRVDTDGGTNQVIYPNATTIDGNWHHIMVTMASGVIKAYVDGVLIMTGAYVHGTGFASPVANFRFGGLDTDGTTIFDEWGVWNTVLTPAEVATIYSKQFSGAP